MLLLVTTDEGADLLKGKNNRDGLIQQVITYVRDGHTVTRKQWVRSEFADHAKKNEEEKKKTILEEQEREDAKRKRDIADNNEKKANQDKRARKKVKARAEEESESQHGRVHHVTDKQMQEYKLKLKQRAKDRKKEDEKRKESQNKDNKKEKKKDSKHSRYGQSDQTRADNKAEQQLIINPK
jgi:hypothetical protein